MEVVTPPATDLLAIIRACMQAVVMKDEAGELTALNPERMAEILTEPLTADEFERLWEVGVKAPDGGRPLLYTLARTHQKPVQLAVYAHSLARPDASRFVLFAPATQDESSTTDNGAEGVIDWDLTTQNVQYAGAWQRLLGCSATQLGPHIAGWHARIHPADYPQVMVELKNFLNGKQQTFQLSHRLRHEDGRYRQVMADGEVKLAANGEAERFIAVCREIGDEK